MGMATIVKHTKDLPERLGSPIPGSRPPIHELLYSEAGDPGEVDAFLELIRELRRESPASNK
jgi:hypothetical protein